MPLDVEPDRAPKMHVTFGEVVEYLCDMFSIIPDRVLKQHVNCVILVCTHRMRPM